MSIDRKKTYFKLYSCCIPVMGKEGAIIVNLDRSTYTSIPLFLCEILTEYDNSTLHDLQLLYGDDLDSIFLHLEKLHLENLGHFTTEPQQYPRMSLDWDTPEWIRNAVLEIEEYGRFQYGQLLQQLEALLCKNIEVWFTANYTLDELDDLLSRVEGSLLRSMTLILRFDHNLQVEGYLALLKRFGKLARVYLYNAPFRIKDPKHFLFGTTEDLSDHKRIFPDVPDSEYLIYLEFFMESQSHNPYYNRKVCIDGKGFIRNCLTHENNFGHIDTHSLNQAVRDPAFTELWYACNDRVLEFKDSEFRYITLNTKRLVKADDYFYKQNDK